MRIAIVMMCLAGMFALPVQAADPAPRTISTSGNAVVYFYDLPPDVTATVTVGKNDAKTDVARAQTEQTDAAMRKAFSALGIDDRDIQATPMIMSVNYVNTGSIISSLSGPVEQTPVFQTTKSYTVRLKDSSLLPQFVAAAMKNGAYSVSDFRYDAAALAKFRDQVRAMAIKSAREKAVALAREEGCEPGRPLTITETNDGGNAGNDYTVATSQWSFQSSVSVTFELKDVAAK